MGKLARDLGALAPGLQLGWPLKHALILVLMVGGGCTSAIAHSISTSEFQRSCSVALDCVPVYEGTLTCCALSECPNAAINQLSYTAYKSTAASRKPTCDSVPCLAITIICKSAAICTGGTCAFEQPGIDAAGLDLSPSRVRPCFSASRRVSTEWINRAGGRRRPRCRTSRCR